HTNSLILGPLRRGHLAKTMPLQQLTFLARVLIMRNGYLLLIVAASLLAAGDPYCPRYPDSVRTEVDASLSLDREAEFYARAARRGGTGNTHAAQRLAASASFIHQLAAEKMNADGVVPARPAGDAEFLRRVSLDLTGRIPSVDRAAAFLDDSNASKRAALLDR